MWPTELSKLMTPHQFKTNHDTHINIPSSPMVGKAKHLFTALHTNNLRYCHWKSNIRLGASLTGDTDIDLLIDRKESTLYHTILDELSFKPVRIKDIAPFPGMEHHMGLDETSGRFLHLHTYFQVITGESLTKNYRFPVEEMLLQNTRQLSGVRVPQKSAELVLFTLRIMLKHTSLVELVMLSRYWDEVRPEIEWLCEDASLDRALKLVTCWLPAIDPNLFHACATALLNQEGWSRRLLLAHRLRSQLIPYRRSGPMRAWIEGNRKFLGMFWRRARGTKTKMTPISGGVLVAFVGSEATGKSTLLAETYSWLDTQFAVTQCHVGKPKPTLLSAVPNLLLPLMRSLLPGQRSTEIERQLVSDPENQEILPLLFMVRAVLLAYDRFRLLTRVSARAANGEIILCDRYPSVKNGAPDSPQLAHLATESSQKAVTRYLAGVESGFYQAMPLPRLIIYLSAPLEVTLSRNAQRGKTEPEAYVRWRHARSANLDFGTIPVFWIDTDQPFGQTVQAVKTAVWNTL